jgi:hypothetical protein
MSIRPSAILVKGAFNEKWKPKCFIPCGGEVYASRCVGVPFDRHIGSDLRLAGVAIAAAGIARILFFVFLIAFLVSLIMHTG